jgi:APA family basic amino acid/polyamine antiporter
VNHERRHLGVFGATSVGVGGIVGGGLLVLTGVAFMRAGPATLVAFALNGLVAFLTAMSFAEMTTAFPESGGAYNFAKKVLSVRAAFAVGWVLWFAYIVAAVLYALGFAAFAVIALTGVLDGLGVGAPDWLATRRTVLLLATLATAGYSLALVRKASGGGTWTTIGKVVLFGLLILAGLFTLMRQPISQSAAALDPFLVGGAGGILAAMGFTFICIQGFEMISAIGGEIREPRRAIPRAMFWSITIGLAIYLPLLFVVATAGVEPGQHIAGLARDNPDTVVAVAVRRFIILSTLSAVHANLLTASRVALAMAEDSALPEVLKRRHPRRKTPVMAIYASALTVVAILFMVPNVASAGAAAGLIFLVAFTLTHLTAYLARRRAPALLEGAFRSPAFPLVPLVGGLACAGLAVFQAIVVPDAGAVALIWLGLGVILYVALFKTRAEAADASAEALDPRLTRLRGKNPLVLLPIANPKNARSLVEVANALAPTEYARVLLLTIVRAPKDGVGDPLAQLEDAQQAVREALRASYSAGHAPEALITAAAQPWEEIRRVAEEHGCGSLLIGLAERREAELDREVENLINAVDCDVAVMRAPEEWRVGGARRVLVPVGGRGEEHELRARLLATLCRDMPREVRFLTVVPALAGEDEVAERVRSVSRLADMNIPMTPTVEVAKNDDPADAILAAAASSDLLVLGLRHSRSTGRKVFGEVTLRIARNAPCATIMLARRQAAMKELTRPLRDAVQVIPFAPRRRETVQ